MQLSVEYPGPSADHYANVLALNHAFLDATSDLKGPQRGRLAAAPFLLFSIREYDPAWWTRAMMEGYQDDLVDRVNSPAADIARIQIAALSFLWHLAGRNPYVARIVSGATTAWCDLVSAQPLVTLLDRVAARGDLLQSRLDDADTVAARLLDSGVSSKPPIQRSSQMTALQEMLTRTRSDDDTRLPAAACRFSGPLRTLDKKV